MTRRVAFVGPLPPPVHGFSNICANMLVQLKARSPVEVFDRAPHTKNGAANIVTQLEQPCRYFASCLKHQEFSLYLALSGGLGQLFDWLYVLISKIFSQRIFIHHHSFSYLIAPSLINKMFFALLRSDTHIVLSRGMGSALAGTYKLDTRRVKVLSNAAFFEPIKDVTVSRLDDSAPIRIGFLSNITLEKGVAEFFAVLANLSKLEIKYRALIAGPVAPAVQEAFNQLLATAKDTAHLGPIYGETKELFYQQLDILLFPTKYANEAEPLVIHEALRSGIHVIACDRGAIAELLQNGAGFAFKEDAFVRCAVTQICLLSADRAALVQARRSSFVQSQRINHEARMELAALLTDISGKIPDGQINERRDISA